MKAYWIHKTHLFRADEFICSHCGKIFYKSWTVCPSCGARMTKSKYKASWMDEAEGLSALLDDD